MMKYKKMDKDELLEKIINKLEELKKTKKLKVL